MPKQEFQNKLDLVRKLIQQLNIEGFFITKQMNFSWLTSGRGHVNLATERATATVVITKSTSVLITNNIEAERLVDEEVGQIFDNIQVYNWYEPEHMKKIMEKWRISSRMEEDTDYEEEWKQLRTILSKQEIHRIEQLAVETAEALEHTAMQIKPGQTEHEISAQLAYHCRVRSIEPIVNLIAVDERVFTRRHPLPTEQTLDRYAMLVVCGRRNGQIISATRLVHFGKPSDQLIERHRAVAYVDALLIEKTRPGIQFNQLFVEMKKAYKDVGFSDEYQYHHQGGLSGYNTREQLLLPDHQQRVQVGQIYAWNPSISGVKSEDTILIGEKENQILTVTGQFPQIKVQYNGKNIKRPDILIR